MLSAWSIIEMYNKGMLTEMHTVGLLLEHVTAEEFLELPEEWKAKVRTERGCHERKRVGRECFSLVCPTRTQLENCGWSEPLCCDSNLEFCDANMDFLPDPR